MALRRVCSHFSVSKCAIQKDRQWEVGYVSKETANSFLSGTTLEKLFFFFFNVLISEKGTVARREGKGNPLAEGPSTELPFVVTMETGIIGTKHKHVAWQPRSLRFITHTHTYS